MNLRDPYVWAEVYEVIREDLHLAREADENAASNLRMMLKDGLVDVEGSITSLHSELRGKDVLVVGAGPECWRCGRIADNVDTIIAADGALRCCRDSGIEPDIVVTDLDGVMLEDLMSFKGIIVVHSHGDNIQALNYYIPNLIKAQKKVVGTSQALPVDNLVHIFGGFTDGDRAAFTAHYFSASKIRLVGFDFSGVTGKYSKPYLKKAVRSSKRKTRKLYWASAMISWLRMEGIVDVECYDCKGCEWL
jgi:uncharacterized Rossmann fold enzyme